MDTQALAIFAEVARCNSFTGAAERLGIPSSNVSNKMARLEQQLNTRLFNRTTRSVKITMEGRELLDKVHQLLNIESEIFDFVNQRNDQVCGTLKILATTALSRLSADSWAVEFIQEYPQVNIELTLGDDASQMISSDFDFAFQEGPLLDSSLIAQKLWGRHFGIYASPSYLDKIPPIKNLDDLKYNDCLVEMVGGQSIPWRFQLKGKSISLTPPAKLKLSSLATLYQAAISGLGLSYLPQILAQTDIDKGALVPVLKKYWPPSVDNYLVYKERELQSPKHRAFIDFVMQRKKELQEK